MFTDMVGYTALTQSNEALAIQVLERHYRLLRPFFPQFNGREVKTIGDSFLVEFESALDALRCALEAQSYLRDYNISSHDDWKIRLRVGIHLGDVVHEAGDVFGDAVNIASRIEPLAEPEGIVVSEQVYDQVRNKSSQPFVKLAPKELKNVQFPIDVYKVLMPWERQNPTETAEYPLNRIAILPFESMSPDPNDEYFADGMTEELISTMSKIGGLRVIARTSIMGYKGGHKKIGEIAKELEAGTVLEGSVRKAGSTLRITVQLVDSQSSDHIWAESYDRELKDVFAVQSEIAKTVANALKVQLLPKEKAMMDRKQDVRPEAYDKYLLAKQRSQLGDVLVSIGFLEEAIRLDPGFALAYADLATNYVTAAADHLPAGDAFAKAREYADRAIELDERLAEAWMAKGSLAMQYEWDWEGSERAFRRAIELNPSSAAAFRYFTYLPAIDSQQAIEFVRKSIDLDPVSLFSRGRLCILLAQTKMREEALQECEKLAQMHPDNINTQNYLALAYAELGLVQDARKNLDQLRATVKARLAAGFRTPGLYATWAYVANAFVYSTEGDLQAIREMMGEAEEQAKVGYFSPSGRGILYLALGDEERGLELLEKGVGERDPTMLFVWNLWCFRPFYSDGRFFSILRKAGIPEGAIARLGAH